ncbi:TPA: hypothetical protein MIA93_15105 [Klebsiella pneumoniae]|uniref:hypothetical protein n=1 Tax=Klebsiella pneumoniae TaxID=573 RepID=UPI000A26F067|nr:hypothetical protein [Klebsiella pneumoniae]EIX9650551.1 hypothetical protein [Klebsiella pneumoniae]MBM1132959.1 hypothetical protein [Klebsiella pneumoniae]MCB3461990.1 hypothetical protein [Klebsiella pneumoniae]MCQ3967107.1 hypothetical protein [Klebsiella pneumoniae]MDN8122089.1 hypothetical protein [Klebsiella pneumoniae subsp. pneumoniae]
MKENLNLLIKKLIGKVFPEFSNKVTWSLITVGFGILALPAPTYLLFINLIIDFYNKTTNSDINLIKIDAITPSNGIALTLILSGLIYHLAIKGIQLYPEILKENNEKETQERKRLSDINLYEQFIEILPPTSLSIELLKNHNFGNSYHNNAVKDFDKLEYRWNLATQHFHDQEIERKSAHLYSEIIKFNYFIACKSHYINGNILSMLTEIDRAREMEWLPQTEENVQKANEWGSTIHQLYIDFISTCKNNLAI